ncbi:hypothetical protein [Microcoleus sp. CAWBG58]|uniref:hypothetical protein n=1 Tax=Microcoleus sp. CAWBG58 TaxID=2841651 RepID=UPI0025EDD57C|nr:hypothetical protein [Microcoleus sp. CAWBG58]
MFFLQNSTKPASAEHLLALGTVFSSSHRSRANTQRKLAVVCRYFDSGKPECRSTLARSPPPDRHLNESGGGWCAGIDAG